MSTKFFNGDRVHIGLMPQSMRHFPGNCEAIVLYSYDERYGAQRSKDKSYGVYILPNGGETAWYYGSQLTLIEPNRLDMLPKGNVHRRQYEEKKARDQGESK